MEEKHMERCIWENKICYTQKKAQATLAGMHAIHVRGSVMPQRAYYCNKCGFYHLTHLKAANVSITARMQGVSRARKAEKYQRKNLLYTDYEMAI